MNPPNKVLCIIHGGGCRQIEAAAGMLKAMDRMGITIDAYRGASAGAIVAALHASSGLSASGIEYLVKHTPVNQLYRRSAWNTVKLFIPCVKCDYIYGTDGLHQFLTDNMHLNKPVIVSVTAYPQYMPLLMPATVATVMASSAIPEVFPPINICGQLYVDGGVLNNVPTIRITDIHAYAHIYILLCPPDTSAKSKPWTKIGRSLQAVDATMDREVEEVKETWSGLDNVTILQPPPFPSSLLDWSDGFGLIDHAFNYALEKLNI
jgi:predicted acylesterase/phospholipase RssA